METLELEDLKKIVVLEGLKLTKARYGTLYLSDEKKNLERVFSTLPKEFQVPIRKRGFTYTAFQKQKFTIIKSENLEGIHKELKDLSVRSIVLIPLTYRKRCIGILSFVSDNPDYTQEETKLLLLYGSMVTLALRQAKLYQDANNAVEVRDLFISLTAHEFRTPLTTINGYAQLLKRKLQKDKSYLLDWAEELNVEVKRLTDMTNELLEISRIKSGKIDYSFNESSITSIVNTAATRFRFRFPEYQLNVINKVSGNDTVIADHDKILQVCSNILENAGKFSAPEKPVTLTLHKEGKWIVVSIKDQGRGIPTEDLENIFKGFYKATNSDHKQGIGLGLFISQSIIQAHKGKMKVQSQLGKGTSFSIYIPAAVQA